MPLTRRLTLAASLSAAAVRPATAATDVDVIVVGAGAAGLAATRALRNAGRTVVCVEARDRIGGRAITDTETFGVPFDVGAHWLHNNHRNPWISTGKTLGFDIYAPPNAFGLRDRSGTDVSTDRLWQAYEAAEAAIAAQARTRKDAPLAEVIATSTIWEQTAAQLIALSMARDLDEISAMDWWSADGGDDSFCRQGFGALVAASGADVEVALNTTVRRIDIAGGQVDVATESGSLRAQACVLTVPLGVLQAGDIEIAPGLAEMQAALDGFSMGTYNHVGLMFAPGAFGVVADSWVMRQTPVDAPPTGVLCDVSGTGLFMVETSGSSGRALEAQGETAMIDFAIEEMAAIFGTAARGAFTKATATRWGAERFTLGSYSGAKPGAAALRARLRHPIAERLFLAGEMCHPGLQATVGGAHLDGERGANDVLHLLA